MRSLKVKFASFAIVVVLLAATFGCSSRTSAKADFNQTLRENFDVPANSPVLLAAYQPWFGRPGHISVGYNSQDPVVQQKQIAKAKNLGIQAFVVNWYGQHGKFEDRAYANLQQTAAENSFQTAIMYDENVDDPQNATEATIQDLRYAYERYIGSHAQYPNAYLRFNGHPLIFVFPKGTFTDWHRVAEAVHSWDEQPLLLDRDVRPRYANAFDGFYAWVSPGRQGWKNIGEGWGEDYLKNFYQTMINNYPNKLAVGAAWPGFNDTKASWSRNRKMDPRCGKTFDESLRLFRRFYTPERPLPYLMIDTWNDYEEGTAIEPGLAVCRGNS
jgi:hypothetical protein